MITLEPMTKFPVVRDLIVDRSRLFDDLKRIKGWVDVDGTHELGPGNAPEPGGAGGPVRAVEMHQLRLLPGGVPAIQ